VEDVLVLQELVLPLEEVVLQPAHHHEGGHAAHGPPLRVGHPFAPTTALMEQQGGGGSGELGGGGAKGGEGSGALEGGWGRGPSLEFFCRFLRNVRSEASDCWRIGNPSSENSFTVIEAHPSRYSDLAGPTGSVRSNRSTFQRRTTVVIFM